MKFFFPDSVDLVDPSFDFAKEVRSSSRVRQRDDLYAHEVFAGDAEGAGAPPPYDGLLVSRAIVEGVPGASGKYTFAQRQRLFREGVRSFFRLDRRPALANLRVMGDCGAFTYVRERTPPVTPRQVVDFYRACGVDLGISVDHVILGFRSERQKRLPNLGGDAELDEWRERQRLTLKLAGEFLDEVGRAGEPFAPIGVAQGWDCESYRFAVEQLLALGYDRVALGGLVPLKTPEILSVLKSVAPVLRPDTRLHLLGISRVEHIASFADLGVTSFDSTSPLRQAFKDDRDNYWGAGGETYPALRLPQSGENLTLKRRIASGVVAQDEARVLERTALAAVAAFDRDEASVGDTLDAVFAYERLMGSRQSYADAYRRVLEDRPWRRCECAVCREIGIHVMLFRGSERNRRRGFHNVWTFNRRIPRRTAK